MAIYTNGVRISTTEGETQISFKLLTPVFDENTGAYKETILNEVADIRMTTIMAMQLRDLLISQLESSEKKDSDNK